MQLLFDALTYHRGADVPLSLFVVLLARVTMVLMTAMILGWVLRRSSAAVLHRLWGWALVGTLAVPLLWLATPDWRFPLSTLRTYGMEQSAGTVSVPAGTDRWLSFALAIWGIGTLACAAYWFLGLLAVRRELYRSEVCRDVRWLVALALAKRELGVIRNVELRVTDQSASPAVWSFWHARVLLPRHADDWSLAQRRSVLLHEVAHVRRQDCAWKLLAAAACTLWWFHPLVWLAIGRLRLASEQAADDCVLRAGTRRTEYAEHLLAIANWLQAPRWPALVAEVLRPSHLEHRLRAVLDPRRRRHPLGRRRAMTGWATAGTLLVLLATVTPVRVSSKSIAQTKERVDIRMQILPQDPAPTPAELISYAPPRVQLAPQTAPAAADVTPVPTSNFQLIPNWEVGRNAIQLLPNYETGTAKVVLVENGRVAAPLVALSCSPIATAIAGSASGE